MHPQSLFK